MKAKQKLIKTIKIHKHIDKAKKSFIELYVTLAILSFSLGFALFISAIIKLIEPENPWNALGLGIVLILVPVLLGIWKIHHIKGKMFHHFKRLKIE